MLNDLVHDDCSWAGVVAALDRAGIASRTGDPWQAEQLRAKIAGTRRPSKNAKAALTKASDALLGIGSEDDRVVESSRPVKSLDLRIALAERRPHPMYPVILHFAGRNLAEPDIAEERQQVHPQSYLVPLSPFLGALAVSDEAVLHGEPRGGKFEGFFIQQDVCLVLAA